MICRSPIAVALLVVLALASIPATQAAGPTQAPSLGPFNILRPILVAILGEKGLQEIQTNIGDLMKATASGDVSKIINAVLSMVDPNNVVRGTLSVLTNYQTQMWNPQFRDDVTGVIQGAAKSFSSGIACWSQNLQENLSNFTNAYVAALKKSFVSNAPNTTAAPGILAAPATIISSTRLIFDLFFAPELRDAVIGGIQGLLRGYNDAAKCARSNTTDMTKNWNDLTSLLMGNGSTGTPAAAPGPVKAAVTAKPAGSGFLGLF